MQAQATGDSRVALDFALTLNIGSTRLSNEDVNTSRESWN
jgi:hypothetical protein